MIVRKIFRVIWKEFIYGGHFQSLGAASIVFISALLLNIKVTWDSLFIAYLIFYPLYLYNHFKEIEKDYSTNPQRTKYFRAYIKLIPIIFYFTIFILLGSLIYYGNLWVITFGLLLLLFGLLYSLIFKKLTKKIAFFKNLYVSAFFAALVFFSVVYYSPILTTPLIVGILIFTVFVYLKAFIMQIFLDIKDIESDKREGLRTFPIIFGKEKTLNILKISSVLITLIIPIILSVYLNIFPILILILFLTIPFNFYCFSLAKRQKYLGYILESGEFLLWSILILVGKVIL